MISARHRDSLSLYVADREGRVGIITAAVRFVASLGRPCGNITGFSFIDFPMFGKWLEMFKEIAPGVKRTTLVFNPQTAPYYPAFLRDFKGAAVTLAAELSARPVQAPAK
jgi:putative ABC transport system substrate-binding protein